MLRASLSFLFLLISLTFFTGCGGGGGGGSGSGGPNPPGTVTLAGVDFDLGDSAIMAELGAGYPTLTLYRYYTGMVGPSPSNITFVYSSTTVGGVPSVRVVATKRLEDTTIIGVETMVFAKAVDGNIYTVAHSELTDTDPLVTWTAGVGGAVPLLFLHATPVQGETYGGGYRQRFSPITLGPGESVNIMEVDAVTPSGLYDHTIWSAVDYDIRCILPGVGFVELDGSGPDPVGTDGYRAVLPSNG